MKFAKGMLIGGLLGAGALLMYSENKNNKKVLKKGKKTMKKLGII